MCFTSSCITYLLNVQNAEDLYVFTLHAGSQQASSSKPAGSSGVRRHAAELEAKVRFMDAGRQ